MLPALTLLALVALLALTPTATATATATAIATATQTPTATATPTPTPTTTPPPPTYYFLQLGISLIFFFRYFDIEIQSCLFHQDIAPERTGLSKFQHLWWIGLAWIWKVRCKCSKLGECVVVESSITSATKQHGISAR